MEIFSHLEPEKILLKEHLKNVGNRSCEIIKTKEINNLNKNVLADVSFLIGISHDFGKFTTFFQKKLKGLSDKNDPIANHGLLSALFAYEIIEEYIKAKGLSDKKLYKFLPLISFFIVKHHHGNLKAIEDDIKPDSLLERGFKYIKSQLEDMETNIREVESTYKSFLEPYKIDTKKVFSNLWKYKKDVKKSKNIEDLIKGIDKSLFLLKGKENKNIIYYLLVQLLYSVLIDSDKKHAGGVRVIDRNELQQLSPVVIETYLNNPDIRTGNKGNINNIREKIRRSVLKNIGSVNINEKIFTLTAPTGTGKTLTALSAALLLRERLKREFKMKNYPRIIYSLPFTSIIDQNFTVFENVLKQIKDFNSKESQYLLKHHHLSDVVYNTEEIDKEGDIDESLALIESWESEIVVTTFIQLFHTLIGYKNRALKKFHNIVNSIILLDEVQNMPLEYWNLIRHILIAIAEYLNCRIILMTATKPLIFMENEYMELVDNYEMYFKDDELNRVSLIIHNEKQTIRSFCDTLSDWSKNSYLFVFNTIGSSLEFYEILKRIIKSKGLSFKLCYLSTNIAPKERRTRIEGIRKSLENNEKIIIVSTQVIEAGVDIDCDVVYRDRGPLDSIIQVAGRCNRNKRLEQGEVHLLSLVKDNNKNYTGIYDVFLIRIVNEILENKDRIPEPQFLELITNYFNKTKTSEIMDEEDKIMKAIDCLYFYDKYPDRDKRIPISDFQLIKEDYYKIDVFVELDKETKDIWRKYKNIITIKDILERKKQFQKIKKRFYDYVISIPKDFKNRITEYDEKLEIGYISCNDLKQLYSFETGFMRSKSDIHTMMS
jgi:CRISPR-associated endonuclease/helicase Cas3